MKARNQTAKVLRVFRRTLPVPGRKCRNGCESVSLVDLGRRKTGNQVLPDPERQGSVNVVYIPDRISHCPTICGGTNHSAGQITRRRKADRLWAINPRKPSTSSRRRSRPKPTNQDSRSSRPCSRKNRPIKSSNVGFAPILFRSGVELEGDNVNTGELGAIPSAADCGPRHGSPEHVGRDSKFGS
jgi:hypothetical protein